MSLKKKILDYVKSQYPAYVHKGTIGRMAVNEWGYENENAGRRCRELENEGVFEKDPNSREAIYRYVPPKEITTNKSEIPNMVMFDIREPMR